MTEWQKSVETALCWIEDNLTEEFSLLELANQAGYSPFYFSRLLRSTVGMTIKKYIANRRLCRAALEIRDTQQRIIDIAVKYGFSSQEALTRALKLEYGCTPYAFRKNPHLIMLSSQQAVLLPEKIHCKGAKKMSEGTQPKGALVSLVNVNVITSDPKRLADFYQNVLDAEIDESHGGPHRIEIWFGPKNASTVCIVANYDEGFAPQTYNTCQGFEFRVADADVEYKRMLGLGVEIKEPPKDLPWGYRYFNIKDPDGNGIDIVAEL